MYPQSFLYKGPIKCLHELRSILPTKSKGQGFPFRDYIRDYTKLKMSTSGGSLVGLILTRQYLI